MCAYRKHVIVFLGSSLANWREMRGLVCARGTGTGASEILWSTETRKRMTTAPISACQTVRGQNTRGRSNGKKEVACMLAKEAAGCTFQLCIKVYVAIHAQGSGGLGGFQNFTGWGGRFFQGFQNVSLRGEGGGGQRQKNHPPSAAKSCLGVGGGLVWST